MRSWMLTLLLVLATTTGCAEDPAVWVIDLPQTGVFPIGQATCPPLGQWTMTVVDPLGAPYIAEDRMWTCGSLPDDSVVCERTLDTAAAVLNITAPHVMYRVDFDDGSGCVYHFGEI